MASLPAGSEQTFPLDPAIRDWVFVPLLIVMFLVGIARHFFALFLQGDSSVAGAGAGAMGSTQGEMNALVRAQRLSLNAGLLAPSSFAMRRSFFCHPETGFLLKDTTSAPNPLLDPANTVEMLKGNISSVLPNMLLMGWVNSFFHGFIVARTPFPLPATFHPMLQRGLDLSGLDPTYVSSLSWYLLNLTGLRGILSLCLGDSPVDDFRSMGTVSFGQPQGLSLAKAFAAERENLELVDHRPFGTRSLIDSLRDRSERLAAEKASTSPHAVVSVSARR